MSKPSIALKQLLLTETASVVERVVAYFAQLLAKNCGLSEAEALLSSRRQCGCSVAHMEDRDESDRVWRASLRASTVAIGCTREEGLTVRRGRARRSAVGTRAPILVEARPNAC